MLYGSVKGCMHLIRNGIDATSPMSYGLTEADFADLTSSVPWIPAQRATVRRTLETLCHATTDLIGLPRFEIPAEYVAGVIAVFVHPVNVAVSCSWLEGRLPHAEDLSQSADSTPQGMEKLTAAQLYAMVVRIIGDEDISDIANSFNKRVRHRMEKAGA